MDKKNLTIILLAILFGASGIANIILSIEVGTIGPVEQNKVVIAASYPGLAKNDPVFMYRITDFLALAMNNPTHGKGIRKFLKKYRYLSSIGFKPGLETGKYREVDPKYIGAIIMAVIIGIGVQWILDKKSFDYDEVTKVLEDMIMLYLQKKE